MRSLKCFNCDPRLMAAVGSFTQALKQSGERQASESLVIEAAILAFLQARGALVLDYLADEGKRPAKVRKLASV